MADSDFAETRQEHLDWCKKRAYEFCDKGDVIQAWCSFISDMNKHSETRNHPTLELGNQLLASGHNNTPEDMKHFIEGFG